MLCFSIERRVCRDTTQPSETKQREEASSFYSKTGWWLCGTQVSEFGERNSNGGARVYVSPGRRWGSFGKCSRNRHLLPRWSTPDPHRGAMNTNPNSSWVVSGFPHWLGVCHI
ncbi:uncharacterized protein LOC128336193 isoform X1 [Hemicordylus capensis]|uniref:uncharacterized protein LOC128336193 isoform X1 n=1 Tax=Hemicordylus capensis TaxID=884348 RepID=UPI0023037050|nr:uncharacterized protein LOC128336193 isoform X1 [Hemicordylus capensis]